MAQLKMAGFNVFGSKRRTVTAKVMVSNFVFIFLWFLISKFSFRLARALIISCYLIGFARKPPCGRLFMGWVDEEFFEKHVK